MLNPNTTKRSSQNTCGGCYPISQKNGKRPDRVTLVPRSSGRPLVWDATCPDTFAPSHRGHATRSAGCVGAEGKKAEKYAGLPFPASSNRDLRSYILGQGQGPPSASWGGEWGLRRVRLTVPVCWSSPRTKVPSNKGKPVNFGHIRSVQSVQSSSVRSGFY